MNSRDNDDKQITDSLKKMPAIKSSREKEKLYSQISFKLNENKSGKSSPKIRFVPAFSIVMVLAILLISVSLLLNEGNLTTNSTPDEGKMENAVSNNGGKPTEKGDYGAAQSNQSNTLMMDKSFQSNVVAPVQDTKSIVHGAVTDEQAQFIIPVTFIVAETGDITKQYNKINDYLKDENWGKSIGEYMLADATLKINRSNNTVRVDLPKEYALNSAAEATMFEETLQSMFGPLQLKKAVFTRTINLGPIGSVKEIKIQRKQPSAYKLYNPAQTNQSFLIPVNLENEVEITTALNQMKQSQQEFPLQRTVPENVHFNIQKKGDLLQLTFSGNIKQNQKSLTMIEAILMTAKSYGFEVVEFKNTGINNIGSYSLTDPIQVPEGVNPVKTTSK